MNREIKFRAWDKKYNLMERGLFGLRSDGMVSSSSHDNVVLLQFTGLKDKNGKEVYEGDIVKIHNYSTRWKHGEPDGDWRVFKVFWNKCTFAYENQWVYAPLSDYNLNTLEEYDIEVIGNIYENGDLLK